MKSFTKRSKNKSIYRQLIRSHLAVMAIPVLVLSLTVYGIYSLQLQISRLTQQQIPTALAAEQLRGGVQRSLAGLRGWIGLGDPQHRAEWQQAWDVDIEQAKNTLFAKNESPTNTQAKVLNRIEDLRHAQWWADDVANSPGNNPAQVTYQFEIEPITVAIRAYLNALLSKKTKNAPGLVNPLIKLQTSFLRTDYLLVRILGDEYVDYLPQLQGELAKAKESFTEIEMHRSALDPALNDLLDLLEQEYSAFELLIHKLLSVRKQEGPNVAAEHVSTNAVPIVAELNDLLMKIQIKANMQMEEDVNNLRELVRSLLLGLLVLIVVSIVSAIILARKRAVDLATPLKLLTAASERLAVGNFSGELLIKRDDEIGRLAEMFNTMRTALARAEEDLHLSNQKLQTRTDALIESNRELEAYSASIAHDLRQPLRGIDGFSYLLLDEFDEKLTGNAKLYLQRIRTGVQRIGVLMDEMLRLSSISRKALSLTQVDLSALAHSICAQLDQTPPAGKTHWEINAKLTVQGDQQLLKIVLTELLDNAQKFSAQESLPCVEFSCITYEDQEIFFIRDNGVGIAVQDQKNLFKPFQHVNTENYQETGSGLAAVTRAVQRHGGRVWVESELEKGTTFFFTLGL